MESSKGSVSEDEFSTFVDGLDYPLYVLTVAHDGERSGCLVGFTTQVSIDPPQMLVCVSDKNHTYRLAEKSEVVALHVLSPDQDDLAELFGEETGDDTDKFAHCSWHPGPGEVPLLDDAPRHLVGRVLRHIPFADHLGLLLEPAQVSITPGKVAYTLDDAADMEPGHPA